MVTISLSKSIMKRLHEELTIAYKLNNTPLYRLIQALLWVGEGKAFSEIARFLQVSTAAIYHWFSKFVVNGFSWLLKQRYQGRGRQSKLSKRQKKTLYDMIVAGPEANGFDCGIWNTAMIAELIVLKFGVTYNPRYLSTLLKKLGLSYQKARFISDRQDERPYEQARKEDQRAYLNGMLRLGDRQAVFAGSGHSTDRNCTPATGSDRPSPDVQHAQ